jgi:hypothetical protein
MTLDQFIEKLAVTFPGKWRKTSKNKIRCTVFPYSIDHCPISAVADGEFTVHTPISAGKFLGLRNYTVKEIIMAADSRDGCSTPLRKRLIEACWLKAES